MRAILPAVLLLAGCYAHPASITSAVLNASLAATTAVVHRAQGGCYATCTHGLVCNPDNGRCEDRPCAKGCGPGQYCDNAPGHTPTCREMQAPQLAQPTPPSTPLQQSPPP